MNIIIRPTALLQNENRTASDGQASCIICFVGRFFSHMQVNNITLKSERHSKTEGTASVNVVDWILKHTKTFLRHSNRRVSFIQHKITLLQTKNRTAYKGQASCMDSFIFFIKKYERVNRIEDGKWTPTLLKSDPQHSWEWTSLLCFTSLNVFQQTQHKFYIHFSKWSVFQSSSEWTSFKTGVHYSFLFIFSLEFSFPLVHCIHFFG